MARRLTRSSAQCRWTGFALVVGAAACSSGAPDEQTNVIAVDTLDGGRVVVSNADPAASDEGHRLSLVVEAEFVDEWESGGSASMLGRPVSIATNRSGRVFVADGQAREVFVFGTGGEFLGSIGRPGDGPGEFQIVLVGVAWQEPDRLWAADALRIQAFDSVGSFVDGSTRRRDGFSTEWAGWTDAAGLVYTGESDFDGTRPASLGCLIRFRDVAAAAAEDTFELAEFASISHDEEAKLLEFGDKVGIYVSVPMAPKYIWTVSPAGTVWLAHTSTYRFDELNFAGDTLRTVILRRALEPLTGAERDSVVAATDFFSDSEIPDAKPFMNAMYVARDGWLWVRRDPRPTVDWDVFDACGRFLGAAVAGAPLGVVAFPGGSTVIGIATDELDVPRIVRMGLRTAEGRPVTSRGCET